MIELSFQGGLYPTDAIDIAQAVFAPHARIERERIDDTEHVRIAALGGTDEATLAGEFCNYVLGSTVECSRGHRMEGKR